LPIISAPLRRLFCILAMLPGLAACAGPQSALDPYGPVAAAIADLWWLMFWGAVAILALVMGLVFYAMFRDPEQRTQLPVIHFLIGAGLVFPTLVLTALLIHGTAVGRQITLPAAEPLHITVTGHQWWWEVYYPADPARGLPALRTANELRLPVGVPVELKLESADVVHSFWVPRLGGKIDMIPGRSNVLRLTADRPGELRGQCAEFCGAQHARMGFVAIAEAEPDFLDWHAGRSTATPPVGGAGFAAFMDHGCADCHAVAGTPAAGEGGPALGGLATRPTLGAGTAAFGSEVLAAWLADHGQTLKPGSHGPEPRELPEPAAAQIAGWLEQLE